MPPFLLSHHPDCETFKGHIIEVGSYRLCIGCFIGYPTTAIAILIIFLTGLISHISLNWFLCISLILISFFILSPLNLTEKKPIKIAHKIILGVGAAFLFWWIWYLPEPFLLRFYYFSLIFGTIFIIFNFSHLYVIYRNCKNCPQNQECNKYKEILKSFPRFLKSIEREHPKKEQKY